MSRGAGKAADVVESRLIGRVGYIAVPGFVGTGAEPVARFSGEICSALTQLAPAASVGWVVDLRQNTGGNMWPMLSGLKPLLGNGNYGAFRDRDGRDSAWGTNKIEGCSAPIASDARVAVLFGPKTASSGEAVVIAFSGRPNSRSFGLATAGLSTANVSLGLPDGGALVLTTAIDIDRTGKAFPAGVVPDVVVESKAQSDDVLAAAVLWLGDS